jgi:hypothetical protein
MEPGWKENGIKNAEEIFKFLKDYKWSSYKDYIGKSNFPSITDREFVCSVMGGENGCKVALGDWIKYKAKVNDFEGVFLE